MLGNGAVTKRSCSVRHIGPVKWRNSIRVGFSPPLTSTRNNFPRGDRGPVTRWLHLPAIALPGLLRTTKPTSACCASISPSKRWAHASRALAKVDDHIVPVF